MMFLFVPPGITLWNPARNHSEKAEHEAHPRSPVALTRMTTSLSICRDHQRQSSNISGSTTCLPTPSLATVGLAACEIPLVARFCLLTVPTFDRTVS